MNDRLLNTMGKAYFVARKYCEVVDMKYNEHQRFGSQNLRDNAYNNSIEDHLDYLYAVLESSEKAMGHNSLGISGHQIKVMAKEILDSLTIED